VVAEHSIHNNVRVRTPSRMVLLPWQSAQDLLARALAASPSVHPGVERFRTVGVFAGRGVARPERQNLLPRLIEAWSAQIREDELPPGIPELRDALRDNSRSS
jgi:hypothetical protein